MVKIAEAGVIHESPPRRISTIRVSKEYLIFRICRKSPSHRAHRYLREYDGHNARRQIARQASRYLPATHRCPRRRQPARRAPGRRRRLDQQHPRVTQRSVTDTEWRCGNHRSEAAPNLGQIVVDGLPLLRLSGERLDHVRRLEHAGLPRGHVAERICGRMVPGVVDHFLRAVHGERRVGCDAPGDAEDGIDSCRCCSCS